MRFRPEQHLRRQSEIRTVREKGRRVDCGAFTLWWLARIDDPAGTAAPVAPRRGPRVCVVASTAAVGKAHRRNLAKRRLRELFRLHQDKISSGLDLLLVSRAAMTKAAFPDLERRFLKALSLLPPTPDGRSQDPAGC